MEEVTNEPLYRDRVCGIDIGRRELYATMRCRQTSARRGGRPDAPLGATKRGCWRWRTGCAAGRSPQW